MRSQIDRLEGGAKDDLLRKYASLLEFDYEAAARLKDWESLGRIIKVCLILCDSHMPLTALTPRSAKSVASQSCTAY